MSLEKRPGSPYWQIVIHHQGERIRRSAGTADRQEAQRRHDEIKAELWATARHGVARTWLDACTAWLAAAPRSDSDRYSLRAFNADYEDRPLGDITADSLTAVIAGDSAGTYNRKRAMLVAILNQAGIEIKLPTRKPRTGRLRFLTRAEWDRLRAALPDHLKPIATFAITTGLRQHNVTHLRWQEVDLARAVMWVHPDEAKAKKPIGIPLAPEAVALLRAQIGQSDEWVFPYRGRGRKEKDRPITKIKTAWQLAMERAGLGHFERWEDADGALHKKWRGDFTFHGLRHTWASWHIMSGTPLEVLQKLGGWEDLRMVQKYAHLAPEYLARWAANSRPWSPEGEKEKAA